jgi:ribonucleoside-diphosphate reductase alpha chain
MSFIQKCGHEMSVELGEEKGVFPNWGKSIFAPLGIRRRNAAITNVPPTGTISMMFDCSGGVEPYFALAYYYKVGLRGKQAINQLVAETTRVLTPPLRVFWAECSSRT